MPNDAPLRGPLVANLAYDGLCTFEFGVAWEVFGLPRPELGPDWYRYVTVAAEPGPMRAAGGVTVAADHGLAMLDHADLIIAPGWRGIDCHPPPALLAALQGASARGARFASLCSGVFVLAAAGLLDGRRATTHWRYAEALQERFPAIMVDPSVLYVDNGQVMTAAGSAAGIDLCLHIVRRDFGVAAANAVARRLVVPPHRDGGQAQFIPQPVPAHHEGDRLAATIAWIVANPAADLSVATLAARAGMSLRTFQRRFEQTAGTSVGAYVTRTRLGLAQALIEQRPNLPLETVAELAGFGSMELMRHHFRKALQVTPATFRQRFATSAAHTSTASA